jgi:hypothetical protein
MPLTSLQFSILSDRFAICRLAPQAEIPKWAMSRSGFYSVSRAADELSVVCVEDRVPAEVKSERGWICFKLEGPFPFSQTGVLASFIGPLAESAIPIFAISTFDTDYVLVKEEFRKNALSVLQLAGHKLITA